MKTRYFLTIVVLIFISGFFCVEGNETLEFDLTERKIHKAFVNDCSEGNYAVTVELKEPYKTYFSELTEKNIGKKLAVTFCGRTLISPIIRNKIDSGTIEVGKWNSEINARQFIKELLTQKNQDNCGKSTISLEARAPTDSKAKKYTKEALGYLSEFQTKNDLHFLNKGIELIEKAIKADNEYVLSYYWKAIMLSKMHEIEKAILTLEEGIENNITNKNDKVVNLYFFRGVLKQKKGLKEESYNDYNEAIEIYKKRLKCNPKDWDAVMNISQALALKDNKKDAVNLLNDTIEKYPEEKIPIKILEDIKHFNVAEYLENL